MQPCVWRGKTHIREPPERFSYRVRLWHRIFAMPEVAACVFSADRPERLFGGLEQRLKRPRLRPPQQSLHLGEGLLDEPITVRMYTVASSSEYTIIASL